MAKLENLPPLEWLRAFEAAARLSGFTAAARELGITQAAVSQRIKLLEGHLGRALFLRQNKGVALTVDGESYLPVVQSAFKSLSFGTESLFGKDIRELQIGALTSHLDGLLLAYLPELTRRFPDLHISVESIAKRSEYAAAVSPVQIRYGRGSWSDMDAQLLWKETLLPVASPHLLTQPEENWRRIDLRGERPAWQEWSAQTDRPPPKQSLIKVDSMAMSLQLAAAGMGVALGSKPQLHSYIQDGRLKKLKWPSLKTKDGYWLTWSRSFMRGQHHQDLLEAIFACLKTANNAGKRIS